MFQLSFLAFFHILCWLNIQPISFSRRKRHWIHKLLAACSPGLSSDGSIRWNKDVRLQFFALLLPLQWYFLHHFQPYSEVELTPCALLGQNRIEMICNFVLTVTLRSQNNIYMEWIWTTADRRLQISTMSHKVKGLKMVSSLTRTIEWLSCLAAVQFYLLELLGDRNVLGASVFWEMMRAMNEIPSSVTCYLLSPLLSRRSMERKAAFKKIKKKWKWVWVEQVHYGKRQTNSRSVKQLRSWGWARFRKHELSEKLESLSSNLVQINEN